MYTVIRHYTAAPKLADELTKRSKDVEALLGSVPGFIAYYLVKTADGAASITVCEGRDGCDESTRRSAEWLRQNTPELKLGAPQIIAGDLAFKFANYKTTGV